MDMLLFVPIYFVLFYILLKMKKIITMCKQLKKLADNINSIIDVISMSNQNSKKILSDLTSFVLTDQVSNLISKFIPSDPDHSQSHI
jgi:hypothetical protein